MNGYRIDSLATTFGARVSGIDLTRSLDEDTAAALADHLLQYRVLVIGDQQLTHADHLRVSRVFGEPEIHVQDQYTVAGFPQIVTISNIHRDGVPIGLYDGDNEEEWHSDLSWKPRMSAVSLLYSVVAAQVGGQTRFADTTAAYDDLPPLVKDRVDRLVAVHSMTHLEQRQQAHHAAKVTLTARQRARVPDVTHPLVREHPVTGRRSLLLGDMIIAAIVGMPDDAAGALLAQLHAHATAPQYVYAHYWRVGDLVIWDNRAVMHTASPCDHTRYQRKLYRTTVM
ncbi:TauD/TfdA family dioxygenase [Nocardia panacis]|uniref:TauD/TfdA family dioxygenase n=1 Tax=Nocardia panacis TaxID=2340916 RepID=A0A3A4K8G8_9NOCA|nr:TauD/TfdA family dioxygenase [Nocardia panacis]RJO77627.1 TauD/TfdA family dioxygenase [Nocardia panacis]